jgi:hypothetical protein
MRMGVAPSAVRVAISAPRYSPRVNAMLKTFAQHTSTTRPLASMAPVASPRSRVLSALDNGTTDVRRPTGAMLTFNADSTICGVTPGRILATRSSGWDALPAILITGPAGRTTSASTGSVRSTWG